MQLLDQTIIILKNIEYIRYIFTSKLYTININIINVYIFIYYFVINRRYKIIKKYYYNILLNIFILRNYNTILF